MKRTVLIVAQEKETMQVTIHDQGWQGQLFAVALHDADTGQIKVVCSGYTETEAENLALNEAFRRNWKVVDGGVE